jgi:hypothetical protein
MSFARTLLSTDVFSQSTDAKHLTEQKERLEQALERQDCPLILDTSKSLLETVFKTILSDRLSDANLNQDIKPLYRSVRGCLQLNINSDVNDKITKLTNTIVHNVSELRNTYGAASHGDDGYFENPVTPTDAYLIGNISDVFCSYLYTRHKESSDPILAGRIYYPDYPEFNDWLDGQYPGYALPTGGEVQPSEIIFKLDLKMYREMLIQYSDTEIEDEEGEADGV